MRVLVAPDSFGGTLSAVEAAEAIAEGWRRRSPGDELVLAPMSDGGPGFVDVLHASLGGELLSVTVPDQYGTPTPAAVLLVGRTAYVESAQACGLHLSARRDP
jgi:glycerate 2-kinase